MRKRKHFKGFHRQDDVWIKAGSGERLLFKATCPYNDRAINNSIELMRKNILGEPEIHRKPKEVFYFSDKKAEEEAKIFRKTMFGEGR